MSDTQSGKGETPRSFYERLRETIDNLIWQNDGDGQGKEVRWNVFLGAAVFLGLVVLTAYSFHGETRWQSTATGFLIAGAALAAGILIGFLFGIPRVRQQTSAASDGQPATEPLAANTNLEQISDWLTKIIVGVGLVQLTKIPVTIRSLADYLSGGFGSPPVPSAIVVTILGFFGIFGFLLGYLWARIYLTGEFSRVERITKDRPEFYEGLIHAYLYQPKPKGFENAIKEGEKYVKRFGDNERVWTYMACAFGQQYSYLERAPSPDGSKMDDAKDKALDAVNHVLQINPGAREFLSRLWDPNKSAPGEDDLACFYGFQKFKDVLEKKD